MSTQWDSRPCSVCSVSFRLFSRRSFFRKNHFQTLHTLHASSARLSSPPSVDIRHAWTARHSMARHPHPAPWSAGAHGCGLPLRPSCVATTSHPSPPASCPQMTGGGVYKIRASEILRGLQISGVMRIRAKRKPPCSFYAAGRHISACYSGIRTSTSLLWNMMQAAPGPFSSCGKYHPVSGG